MSMTFTGRARDLHPAAGARASRRRATPSARRGRSGPDRVPAGCVRTSVMPNKMSYRRCGSRWTSTRRCTTTGTRSPRRPAAASASTCPTRSSSTGASRASSPSSCEVVIADTHSDEAILAGTPYPGAVETVARLARGGPLHPRHEPPRRRVPPGDRDVAGADRPAVRRPALLLRQGQPLRRARDRHPGRRQPGQHPPARSSGASPRRRSSTRGTRTCATRSP